MYWMIQKGKKGEIFFKKMKQSHHEGGNMGFLKTKIRETKPERDLLRRRVLGS